MDKLKTIATGGFPLVLDDLRQFFGRLDAPSEGIYQAFNNLLRGFGDNFIVQGVVASGTTPNVEITEGWVLLDGELIKVDAQSGIDTTTDNKFVKETTFNSRGTKTFLNGSIAETYEINRAVVQGTTGNLDFDGDTLNAILGLPAWTVFDLSDNVIQNDSILGAGTDTTLAAPQSGSSFLRYRKIGKTIVIQLRIIDLVTTTFDIANAASIVIKDLPWDVPVRQTLWAQMTSPSHPSAVAKVNIGLIEPSSNRLAFNQLVLTTSNTSFNRFHVFSGSSFPLDLGVVTTSNTSTQIRWEIMANGTIEIV